MVLYALKLVIAEKPSVAQEIAKVLKAGTRGKGFYHGNEYIVSWCVGHLVTTVDAVDYDEKYAKWLVPDLPIIPPQWKYKVSESTKDQFQVVSSLMNREDVTEIVCATDAGREGELIFRLVYNQAGCTKPFKRLWISSMETKAIEDGFAGLKEGKTYDRLYDAALCRLQADWLVGINFSRLFSCLSSENMNIGRVQTPTVNLIVERQRAIDSFDSRPYYVITAACNHKDCSFSATKRVESKEESEKLLAKCKDKPAKVMSMTKTAGRENPSALYDLTTLQREANKFLGLSAQQTLDATQNLYEKKLVTYPRTDSRYLTGDMKDTAARIIESLLHAPYIDGKTREGYDLSKIQVDRLINDKKVTDHHGIIPTIEAHRFKGRLTKNEENILILISYKLLMSPYIPHEFTKTELLLDIEGEEFKGSGRQVVVSGFKDIASGLAQLLRDRKAAAAEEESEEDGKKKKKKTGKKKDEEAEEEVIPALSEGEEIGDVKLSSKENTTKPPKAYTEDTLLSAMENAMRTLEDEELKKEVAGAGLGTPATRAGIIERIINTGYISRKGKYLYPTEKAYQVVDKVPEKVKSPELTAEWEQKLDEIYKGKAAKDGFMEGICHFVEEVVGQEASGCNFDEDGREIIGKCPRCGKNVYQGKKSYYCQDYQDCGFSIFKENMFFTAKKKPLTKPMVKVFLRKGRIKAMNLYSEKKDSYYNAYIFMDASQKYPRFYISFKDQVPEAMREAQRDGAPEPEEKDAVTTDDLAGI